MTAFQLIGWKLYAQTVTRKITFCCIPVRLSKKWSLDVYTLVKDIATKAFLLIVGLPCMNQAKFKQLERRVGGAVERTTNNSCSKWMEKEKLLRSGFAVQKTLKGTSW